MGKQISHLIKNHFTRQYGEGGVLREWSDEPMTRFSKWGVVIDPFEFLVID